MIVFLGSDHAGVELKERLLEHIRRLGHEIVDLGPNAPAPVDYPERAQAVAKKVLEAPARHRGVLICGSGVGMSITANRFPGIRAALCADAEIAKLAREHNDANVIVLAGRFIATETALRAVEVFLATPFSGETRHARRIAAIECGGRP